MLRKATPTDAEAIENVRIAAWRAEYLPFMPPEFLAGLDPLNNIDALREWLTSRNITPAHILCNLEKQLTICINQAYFSFRGMAPPSI
jgi:hypothetical protein